MAEHEAEPAAGVTLRPGVETLTITGARPGAHLRVEAVDPDGGDRRPVVTLVADAVGNAHVGFVAPEHRVLAETPRFRVYEAVRRS